MIFLLPKPPHLNGQFKVGPIVGRFRQVLLNILFSTTQTNYTNIRYKMCRIWNSDETFHGNNFDTLLYRYIYIYIYITSQRYLCNVYITSQQHLRSYLGQCTLMATLQCCLTGTPATGTMTCYPIQSHYLDTESYPKNAEHQARRCQESILKSLV